MALTAPAHANGPKVAIAALDARLAKFGAPEFEGVDKAGEKSVSGLYFGARKINNDHDMLGTSLSFRHNPLHDSGGPVIGVSCVGPKDMMAARLCRFLRCRTSNLPRV